MESFRHLEPYGLFLAPLFGALWGSFLNVCIYRIPLGQNLAFPASRCPHCESPIRWFDNIPLFSWLWLRGRCRRCAHPISPLYPAVESLTALLTWQVVWVFGFRWESLALVALGYAFIVLMMIDFDYYILPDVVTLPGMVIGLAVAWIPTLGSPLPSLQDALIGAAVGGGGLWLFAWLFKTLTGKEGMGLGDVKLLAMIGAWLGWQALPFTLFGASLLGSVMGIGWILLKGRDRSLPIPFGPYLVLAAWSYLYVGADLYRWYLQGFVPGY